MSHRRSLLLLATTCAVLASTGPAYGSPAGSGAPRFHAPSRADDPSISGTGTYASEPATVVAADGSRYVANQLGSQLSYTRDGGRSWTHVGGQDLLSRNIDPTSCQSHSDIGDVDLTADPTGRVYLADLQVTTNSGGNGADTGIEPIVGRSDDRFAHYTGECAAHQPASVDREWLAAYAPPGAGASSSDVYLSYHDFSINTIWVNASHDGGQTWSQPVNVINDPAAQNASACDTVPAGTAVDPRNGWIYVGWTAGSNALSNAATGCNYTQGAVFNQFWVAVSKDGGRTWTDSLALAGPDVTAATPSDMSEIFGSISVARSGDVYIAFPAYLNGEYDVYAAYSSPAGAADRLNFANPVKVNGPSTHTNYFARIVAGDRGRVDVIYLASPVRNVVSTPQNKLTYDGSDPSKPNCRPETSDPGGKGVRFIGKPCEMPASAPWYLYLAQSLDLTSATATFTPVQLRSDPVHVGDICTLGIFCLSDDNRDLADTNDVKIDATGGAQVAYTAETPNGARTEIDFQCQSGGPGLYAGVKMADCQRH
ncbi:MAG TPA: sialidase family protein [Jatrophihabitans sp.]|jgi:hypothetical protein